MQRTMKHARYSRRAAVDAAYLPSLPPLHPDMLCCGNCAAWNGFGSGAGGRCGDQRSSRVGNVIARSTAGCPMFSRAGTQLSLMV